MRKIIVTEFITLDGVIEAPGGDETDHPHGGWNSRYSHPDTTNYKIQELASVDALLLGKKTYEQFAAYWPGQTGGGFADRINSLPKYVVSRTLRNADWNNSHILRNVAEDVSALKKTPGGNILVYGSGTLAKALLHYNLVDQLTLMLHPVIVGGGLRLFDDNRELNTLELTSSKAVENGILILEYHPGHR